ncbi:MAG: hypothetical protein SPL67_03405 [Prevotella sp.]|jgi:hypothetical protein|nr:hypothetical protein [Prevotella sp.]
MKELQPNLLDDYEHLISRGIELHSGEAGFPQMEEAGITREELDDFLFEVQSALDSEGSQKAQLTKYGIVAVLPIIIFSAFPENMLPGRGYALYLGIGIGLLLALLWKGLSMLSVRHRISNLRRNNEAAAGYADKVEAYVKRNVAR